MIKNFLDRMLKSRLGIRILVEHHVALHDEKVKSLLHQCSVYNDGVVLYDTYTQSCLFIYSAQSRCIYECVNWRLWADFFLLGEIC